MEHDRLTDGCIGCGDAYNTKAYIKYHVYKHHAALAFDLCLVWLVLSGQATILEHTTTAHVHALCWMWQHVQLSQIPRHTHMEHDRLTDICTECGDVYNTKAYIEHHVWKHHAYFAFCL